MSLHCNRKRKKSIILYTARIQNSLCSLKLQEIKTQHFVSIYLIGKDDFPGKLSYIWETRSTLKIYLGRCMYKYLDKVRDNGERNRWLNVDARSQTHEIRTYEHPQARRDLFAFSHRELGRCEFLNKQEENEQTGKLL
jgi:hypothetical protein